MRAQPLFNDGFYDVQQNSGDERGEALIGGEATSRPTYHVN